MNSLKNGILGPLILCFCFYNLQSTIPSPLPKSQKTSREDVLALIEKLNKVKDDGTIEQPQKEIDSDQTNQEAIEQNKEEQPQGNSRTRKILLGTAVIGTAAAALICAAIIKYRNSSVENENERFWRQAEGTVRAAPPAPAEIQGPTIRNIEDIQADPTYRDPEPHRHGLCEICYTNGNLMRLENSYRHKYCRGCLLHTVLTAYQNTRQTFDRISPAPGEVLTRNDIQRITGNNARMLNAFDIAQYNHDNPGVAGLANITPEQRRNSRPCPRCLTPIQRNQGCRHMTCRCGHEFCWHCLRDLPGYRHAYPDCGRF